MENQKGYQKINQDFYINKTKILGKGAFGTVYLGYSKSKNQQVAIKLISRLILNQPGGDYYRQLKIMEQLNKIQHHNIMQYYGYIQKQQGIYCFLQLCTGGSLKDLILKEGKLEQLKVLKVLKQLLEAMAQLNKQNKLHRDLKPDNIMFNDKQELKLADFGLARQIKIDMTKGACTPLYAAPQVFIQQQYDQRCDVWSAGMILYEMLMGKQYFNYVHNRDQLQRQLKKFGSLVNPTKIKYPQNLHLHQQWGKLTNQMLTYNRQKRMNFPKLLERFEKVSEIIKKDLMKKYGTNKIQQKQDFMINLNGNLNCSLKSVNSFQPEKELNQNQNILKNASISLQPNAFLKNSQEFKKEQKIIQDQLQKQQKLIQEQLQKQSKFKKQKQKIMQRVAQQRSYQDMTHLRKFIYFYRLKAQFMTKLTKLFQEQPGSYPYLQNVYKYLLMFLSIAGYLAKMKNHLKQLKNKKISTPDGPISMNNFIQQHKPQVEKIFNQFIQKIESSIKHQEQLLKKSINKNILEKYMKRQPQKTLIKQLCDFNECMDEIPNLVQKASLGQFYTQFEYMNIYRVLMNHPKIHIQDQKLQKVFLTNPNSNIVPNSDINANMNQSQNNPQDQSQKYSKNLKIYAYIRIIGYLEQIFQNGSYKQDDYLTTKRRDIQNKTSYELIKYLKKWNNANQQFV